MCPGTYSMRKLKEVLRLRYELGLGQGQLGRPVPFQHLPQGLDLLRWPGAEVGEGAVAHSAAFAEELAEQHGGRGVPVGDDGNVYAHIIIVLYDYIKRNIHLT